MCSKATCKKCGKATWRGCGNHIEQALAGVPKNQRCTCASTPAASGPKEGLFARLRGR
ncbi:MAG: hypothetical protein HIU57_01800 [Acidobacteria bacterium]|nr:hypothetical protein [Acidobacteriota bacterium]